VDPGLRAGGGVAVGPVPAAVTPGDPAFDRAVALQAAGDLEGAAKAYAAVVAARPDHAGALNNLGNVRRLQGRPDDAVPLFERAYAVDPGDPMPLFNLGSVHLEAGRAAAAAAALQTGLRLDPAYAVGWLNLGQALDALGAAEPADAALRQAHALDPSDPAIGRILGARALARGDWAAGWPAWALRWREPTFLSRRAGIGLPAWVPGAPGPVLVWGEQGLGEEILFSGLVEAARSRLPDPVVEIDPRLVDLFRRSRSHWRIVPRGTPHGCVSEVPFGDLALLDPAVPLPPVPPLRPDAARVAVLRTAVDAAAAYPGRPRIGLGWSSPGARLGILKSLRLADLAPLLAADATFVALQYGAVEAEVAAVRAEGGADLVVVPGLDRTGDLDGLAALVAGLDLVVTTSSTTAHLAAALGVPTWVLVPRGAGRHWYWAGTGEAVPWYPSARVFRQHGNGSFAGLAAEAARALAAGPIRAFVPSP